MDIIIAPSHPKQIVVSFILDALSGFLQAMIEAIIYFKLHCVYIFQAQRFWRLTTRRRRTGLESICTQVQLTIFFLKLLYHILMPKTKGGRGHVPYQAGGEWFDPHPAKKLDFFIQNVKNILHALKTFFYYEIKCKNSQFK